MASGFEVLELGFTVSGFGFQVSVSGWKSRVYRAEIFHLLDQSLPERVPLRPRQRDLDRVVGCQHVSLCREIERERKRARVKQRERERESERERARARKRERER